MMSANPMHVKSVFLYIPIIQFLIWKKKGEMHLNWISKLENTIIWR